MREKLSVLLLVGLVSSAGGGVWAQSEVPGPGSRWDYEFRDRQYPGRVQTFRVDVAAVEGQVVRELFFVRSGEVSSVAIDRTGLRFIQRPLDGDVSLAELSPYWLPTSEPPPLPTGYPGGVAVMWRIEAPVYTREEITVPAGTFQTVRMEVTGRAPAFGQGTVGVGHVPTRFVYTIWYARTAGRYVQLRHQTWNRWEQPTGDEIVQLLTYERLW